MSGVKGRSGRRKRSIEQKHLDTIDLSWLIMDKALKDDHTPTKDKIAIALLLVGKDISRKQEHRITPDIQYISNTPRPLLPDKTQVVDIAEDKEIVGEEEEKKEGTVGGKTIEESRSPVKGGPIHTDDLSNSTHSEKFLGTPPLVEDYRKKGSQKVVNGSKKESL